MPRLGDKSTGAGNLTTVYTVIITVEMENSPYIDSSEIIAYFHNVLNALFIQVDHSRAALLSSNYNSLQMYMWERDVTFRKKHCRPVSLQNVTGLGRAIRCICYCSIITSLMLKPDKACPNLIHLTSHAEWVHPTAWSTAISCPVPGPWAAIAIATAY